MTVITAAAGGGNWGTGSTWVGGVAPTAADDALLTATSGAVTIDGTSGSPNLCRSLNCTGYTNTLTHAATKHLTVGDGTTGNFTLVSGMTYAPGATAFLNFVSTAGTTSITSAGKTLGAATFNGVGGTFQFADNTTGAGTWTLTNGTVDFNSKTMQTSIFTISGTSTKVVTFGSTTLTLTSTGTSWNVSGPTGTTINSGTGTIIISGNNAGFLGGGFTYNNVTLSGTGEEAIRDSNTFANLTRTGTAVTSDLISFNGNQTITGTLTLNGNSASNRLLVCSFVDGTQRTLTAATVSCSNADFEDIVGAGAGSWNLSAITGLSGDCGNNSGITFTTAATNYWVGGGGTWRTVGEWASTSGGSGGTGRVPLPQDTAIFDANSFSAGSQTVTQDMSRICTVDWTGVTNTPTWTTSTACRFFGSITLVSGMTLTASSQEYTMGGTGSASLTSAGKTWAKNFTVEGASPTLTLADAYVTAGTLTCTKGTLTAVGNVNFGAVNIGANGTLNMGSGTWENAAAGITWTATGTINADTSTLYFSYAGTSAKTFNGNGKTYYKVEFAGAASIGAATINGANTYTNALKFQPLAYIKFHVTNTQTFSSASGVQWSGTAGNLVTIESATAGNDFPISCASGTVSCDYISLKDSTASGGAAFYAGANSTNVSGNTGWTFTAPPAATALGCIYYAYLLGASGSGMNV